MFNEKERRVKLAGEKFGSLFKISKVLSKDLD